jgi:hypothetical protein
VNWEAIGAIGELLSATAVFVTLIYVAFQVRNARKELQHNVLNSRDVATRELLLETIRNPLLGAAIAESDFSFREKPNPVLQHIKEVTSWSDEKTATFVNYQTAYWFHRVEVVREVSELTPAQKQDFDLNITFSYSDGLGNVWWEEWKKWRPSGDPTVKYCDEILSKSNIRPGT